MKDLKKKFEEGVCKTNALWCDFKPLLDNEDVVKEVCRFCNKYMYYNKVDGRIDNKRYFRAHIRDFCQPYGVTRKIFIDLYGYKAVKDMEAPVKRKEQAKRNMEAMDEEFDDYIENERSYYYGGQTEFK